MDSNVNAYTMQGNSIACPVCGSARFYEGTAQLNTRVLTFLNLDWLNETATTLICEGCGYIMWFAETPERARTLPDRSASDTN